ncbi:MAG: phosphatidate cytidylyltransferase [Desulfobulbaceae bacterium]|nr:phosphatidate cytidylyltransferase [Desulfobulbaceae bacterium]
MGRVIPGLLMAAFWVVFVLFAPSDLFWLFSCLIGAIALYEFFRMACPFIKGHLQFMAITISLLPLIGAGSGENLTVSACLYASLLGIILLVITFYSQIKKPFELLGMSIFGTLTIAFCLAHLVLIRSLDQGHYWLLVLTTMTGFSDTGAYYFGRAFGKKKLCPAISPGKTLAGALGGVGSGMVATVIFGLVLLQGIDFLELLLIGLVLSPVGILGDLTESITKRTMGVKDSGTLLGGHGGLLDRIDSLLFTGPILYYLLIFKIV